MRLFDFLLRYYNHLSSYSHNVLIEVTNALDDNVLVTWYSYLLERKPLDAIDFCNEG